MDEGDDQNHSKSADMFDGGKAQKTTGLSIGVSVCPSFELGKGAFSKALDHPFSLNFKARA